MAHTEIEFDFELERFSHGGMGYHAYKLEVKATVSYCGAPSRDDPGPEVEVEIERVMCGGEAFDLTSGEETEVREAAMQAYDGGQE